ncbi:hypothetical protein [Devosia sediminis]|uniref:DUF4304 domain-containing protein n=1 Tax=Devosia sediminis TaxID=2798801 RepID=A0A934IWD0_9HYPH|nr:hypothetical protein [Devosia sediminis]MBJ3784003.1 hypothetical protein [Devosia sediminis]
MSTAKEIKAFVAPFLERHPELRLHKRRVFRPQVRHCVVGISFEVPHYRGEIIPRWEVSYLFAPPPYSAAGFGGRLEKGWGELGDPGLQTRVFADMDRVLQDIIPAGTSIENAIEVNRHAPSYFGEMTPQGHALLLAALGRFEEAQPILQEDVARNRLNFARAAGSGLKGASASNPSHGYAEWLATIENLEKLLELLRAQQTLAVSSLLHEWEAIGAEYHGIKRYWEPSPFPFERV